ncbi:MAG: 6-phosphofructokinase [Lentisphaerales bacterium]|jgi:6-phosphofructokinase 1|nr:MAG: 6-phosphofructokinase [Lentisphaerales bacterium]
MPSIIKANMLIAQSGGPTAVINQSLVGAVLEARKHSQIDHVYGAVNGIRGILEQNLVLLDKESGVTLEAVANTPSSALGTIRRKPSADDCERIFKILRSYNVRYFFYIGGNDSAETALIINDYARSAKARLHCFHIPKTIDNDLRENDHTPGFGSAAKFVAMAFMGDNLDNMALPGVKINVVMGRHAGFLTAASVLARVREGDGPHLIYLPERPFNVDRFVKDVQKVYDRHGRCLVAVSEGIVDEKGAAIAAKFSTEKDSHGNVQLSGTGALGDLLAGAVRSKSSITRVRADTFGYLQRSFPDIVSEPDSKEARAVGIAAVREAVLKGQLEGSITIRRRPGNRYRIFLRRVSLTKVARETRCMSPRFMNQAGNDVTTAFVSYVQPIVGPLPTPGRLACVPAPKPKGKK